jgi:hypothetical protein
MLDQVEQTIRQAPERAQYAMNNFIYTVGVSCIALHEQAVETAKRVGLVEVGDGKGKTKSLNAVAPIQKAVDKGRIGFKRKHVRC